MTCLLVGACKDDAKPKITAPPPETTAVTPPAAVVPPPGPPVAPNAPPTDLARGANQFALALWSRLPAEGNLAVSPASIAIPLAITWGGAKGATATQLQQLLGLSGAPDIVLSRWGNLAKSLTEPGRPLTLAIANRLYAEKTYDVDTTYFTVVRHAFDVWIEPVDFMSAAEPVRQKINTWVAEQTQQRIKNLVPPNALGPATKLVLVNAIYFLADWATPFDPMATQPREFWINGRTKTEVPTMTRQASFRYAKANGAALVELPYRGDSASMYVIVPDARDGLPAIEKDLKATFASLQPKLAEKEVLLALPKFTIDPPEAMKLDQALVGLGITDAFDPEKADFTGMAKPKDPRQKFFISSVIHKAFVKVDETGTEAAAATAIVGKGGGGPPPPATTLVVDHPFLFVIVDKATGLMLFLGRVVDPK